MAKFYSTKTYGNDRGLSCCFRQWRANHTKCSTLHGYSLGIKLVFECEYLDERNWVMDFDDLDDVEKYLRHMFDHTVLVSESDPMLPEFQKFADIVDMSSLNPESEVPHTRGAIMDLRVVEGVGCEMFAKIIFHDIQRMMFYRRNEGNLKNTTVTIKSVEVFEHGANSAIYED